MQPVIVLDWKQLKHAGETDDDLQQLGPVPGEIEQRQLLERRGITGQEPDDLVGAAVGGAEHDQPAAVVGCHAPPDLGSLGDHCPCHQTAHGMGQEAHRLVCTELFDLVQLGIDLFRQGLPCQQDRAPPVIREGDHLVGFPQPFHQLAVIFLKRLLRRHLPVDRHLPEFSQHQGKLAEPDPVIVHLQGAPHDTRQNKDHRQRALRGAAQDSPGRLLLRCHGQGAEAGVRTVAPQETCSQHPHSPFIFEIVEVVDLRSAIQVETAAIHPLQAAEHGRC